MKKKTPKSNYLKTQPDGKPLANEKSSYLAGICDEKLDSLPELNLIPEGLVLICVVDNGTFEAALVCDNEFDWNRVKSSSEQGDQRPVNFFLIKREWVNQMAERPLEGGR